MDAFYNIIYYNIDAAEERVYIILIRVPLCFLAFPEGSFAADSHVRVLECLRFIRAK